MKHRYVLLKTDIGPQTGYGIAAVADYDESAAILQSYSDIAITRSTVLQLVELCNRLELSLSHFAEVVEDFLAA